ncbi:MAG TPA: LptA/OstA family protein [Terriglobia bacterium]|nr:LptA/OstA family protein [Terriglobia bacterium]
MNDSIKRHVRGKRWIKLLTGAGLVITAGIVLGAYWLAKSERRSPLPKPPALPKDVHQQLSGVTFARTDKGRQLFVIHAARTLAYKEGGSILLKDVDVEFFGRSGQRRDILRTPEGEYNQTTGNLSTPDDVEMVLNATPSQLKVLAANPDQPINQKPADADAARQPVYIRTSKVNSTEHGTQLESDTPVQFHLGNISGSARGLIYGSDKSEITLKQDVQAVFHPAKGAQAGAPIEISASRLHYSEPADGVQLWGPVKIHQAQRMLTASKGLISMNEHSRITKVVLQGNAHAVESTRAGELKLQSDLMRGDLDPITSHLSRLVASGHSQGQSTQGGALSQIEAQEVVLNFNPVTHVPANGAATGKVRLTITQAKSRPVGPSAPGTPGGKIAKEVLATEKLLFSFRPKGKNLKQAETSGSGTLVLYPENSKAGNRTVTAAKFLMAFNSTSHLESLRGTGGTRIVSAPPANVPNHAPAVSTARELLATFDPTREIVQSVEQIGDFHFNDGTVEAKADEARDLTREQKLILTGRPEVWDSSTRTRADQIVLLLASDTAEGIGGVHSIHTDPQNPSALPTSVVAERMTADRRSQVIHYQGHVRAWRGTDVVESPSLDIYRNERRVSTNSPVLTSHLQAGSAKADANKGTASGPRPVRIRADRLDYFDEGRKARYIGHVEFNTEDTRIQSDRLDVYFSAGGTPADSQVDRAQAEGHVKIVQPMRYAKGENAVYDAQTGKVVMTGGPPTVYDTEKGTITGQRLTFNIHNDSLLVDGSANSPVISKHHVVQ